MIVDPKKIGVDFSGALAHFGRAKSLCALEEFGVHCCPQMFKRKQVQPKLLSADQYERVQQLTYGPEYGLRLDPVPGVVECLSGLVLEGHELYVVTSRTGSELKVAKEWWKGVSDGVPMEFIGTGRGKSKGSAVRDLGLHFLIDDDLKKLVQVSDEGADARLLLFSWCYNAHKQLPDFVQRLSSWNQFPQLIASAQFA